MNGILSDILVLDFGRFIAAPYCGMILADMGADVIRVDRPGGEEDRNYGLLAPNGENLSYPSYARNKRGITLNLLKPESRPVLYDLVRKADVVLHNFSPAAAAAMGLQHEALREINPKIIYTGVSCYGAAGPYSKRIGFDPIAQSLSGAASFNGFPDDPPVRSQLPWVDYSTGLCAGIGTLLALRHRDRTGEGQAVDLALLQTAISFTAPMIAEATLLGRERPKIGNRTAYVGASDMFRCKDGYVYCSVILDAMFARLMKVVGAEDLLGDPELDTDMKRFENFDRINPRVAAWMEGRTVADVMEAMEAARIPCAPALATTDVPDDPHIRDRGLLEYCDLEFPGLNHVPISGIPVTLSKSPGSVRRRAPRVGEHNAEIYETLLGYDRTKLDSLRVGGVI